MAASRTPTVPSAKNLISIKRIGEIGAAVLLITIVNTGSFAKRGHLAAFLGMTPGASQSNDSMRVGRTTKRGATRPASPLPGNFSTHSSTRPKTTGCSRTFRISQLNLAINHRRTIGGRDVICNVGLLLWMFIIAMCIGASALNTRSCAREAHFASTCLSLKQSHM